MTNDHQQAADRLAMECGKFLYELQTGKGIVIGHAPTIYSQHISRILNLPQLLADQARCKELERDLEATGRAVIARDYRIGGLGEENDNIRARITELEAEVARLKNKEVM